MTPEDRVLWEVQLRQFISQHHEGFLLFHLGPFPSGDPDQACRLLGAMLLMEEFGSFGQHLALTEGSPADPHYVLDALRMKEYEDWLDQSKDRAYQDWWNHYFSQLKAYVKKHGEAEVRWLHAKRDLFCLGIWCVSQRRKYHAGKLRPDEVKRLEALRGWSWGPPGE